jgi:alkanesulfonate monooxygenase SsuD/methylene tetrahydromethanopterin reductase-like flavin-dependent oxidoreductase (luciferase family)
VDVLSGGRLTLGMAPGGREDDYEVGGVDFHRRGAIFDRQLDELHRLWSGEKVGFAGGVGPQPRDGRPPIMIGGSSAPSYARAARHAGWIMGGGPPDAFKERMVEFRAAWSATGRGDEPRVMALGYYGLGDGAREQVHRYITDYYAFIGEAAEQMAAGIATDDHALKDLLGAFEQEGCDEYILFPTSSDPAQVELLAEAVL